MTNTENYNFDKILNKIGILGRYQIISICMLWVSILSLGTTNLAFIYLAAVPKYWCSLNDTNTQYDISTDRIKLDDPCGYNSSQNEGTCDNWEFDTSVYGSTVVTEWLFVCSSEWMSSLLQTTYMCGILLGAFTGGFISDRFGRKKCWLVNFVLMSMASIISSFMPNYWAFIAIRVLVAMGNSGTFLSAIVMTMETLASKYRMKVGMYYQLPFAVGYMMLSGIAYFIRDFRYLNLCIGLIPILSFPCYCFLDESPRWLLTRGRFDEAKNIVRKMCETNKLDYPTDLMEKEIEMLFKKNKAADNLEETSISPLIPSVSIVDLLKPPRLRWRIMAISFGWVLCSLTYYGLSQASSDLPGGPYLNLFLSGLTEFPGIIFCGWLLDKIGRKWSLAGVFFIVSFCSFAVLITYNVSSIVVSVLSMIGKMAISGGFAVVYVYTIELFPTVIRTIALGTGSMCSRIGSIASPNIFLLSNYWIGLPYLVFGCFSFVGAIITLILPETHKQQYQETIEDGEKFGGDPLENFFEFPCSCSKIHPYKEKDSTTTNDVSDVKL